MLKKAAHIGLIILLLVSTVGVTICKHYCGTSVVKQSINIAPAKCCKGNCPHCHNKSTQFKITDRFQCATNQFDFKSIFAKLLNNSNHAFLLLTSVFQNNNLDKIFCVRKICNNNSSPFNTTAKLQVFRL